MTSCWLRVTFNTVIRSNGEHWEWVLALLANMEPAGGARGNGLTTALGFWSSTRVQSKNMSRQGTQTLAISQLENDTFPRISAQLYFVPNCFKEKSSTMFLGWASQSLRSEAHIWSYLAWEISSANIFERTPENGKFSHHQTNWIELGNDVHIFYKHVITYCIKSGMYPL